MQGHLTTCEMCPESVKAKYRFKVLQSKSAPATMGGVQLANAKEEQLRIEQLVTSTPHAASGQEAQISYVSESLQSLRGHGARSRRMTANSAVTPSQLSYSSVAVSTCKAVTKLTCDVSAPPCT